MSDRRLIGLGLQSDLMKTEACGGLIIFLGRQVCDRWTYHVVTLRYPRYLNYEDSFDGNGVEGDNSDTC